MKLYGWMQQLAAALVELRGIRSSLPVDDKRGKELSELEGEEDTAPEAGAPPTLANTERSVRTLFEVVQSVDPNQLHVRSLRKARMSLE